MYNGTCLVQPSIHHKSSLLDIIIFMMRFFVIIVIWGKSHTKKRKIMVILHNKHGFVLIIFHILANCNIDTLSFR